MFDLDYLTNSMNYEPVLVENQANKFAGLKEANNNACTQANDDQSANSEETKLHEEYFVLPIWSAYSTTVKSSRDKIVKTIDFKTCEKPISQVEQIFQEELEKLKRHEKEANVAARKETTHEKQDVNLLTVVSTPISIAGPSRALNDGEPSYPDDPLMPYLKDIYASPSEGIFTDSSYDDEGTFKIQKVWILVDLPFGKKAIGTKWVYRNKKDEKGVISAFLHGTIDEEVYVIQPPSFVDTKFPNKKSWSDEFEELMKNRFQISSMGELAFFLGLQVKQKEDGIFISQDNNEALAIPEQTATGKETSNLLMADSLPITILLNMLAVTLLLFMGYA
uniref:Uncharacterized protein n=1 Tax=Tanacetum cinerariifolium TaxID=118510 RepID=A0A699GU23_TANCI|nr:hypothetical protein [Tanacetum cinerariifolium]